MRNEAYQEPEKSLAMKVVLKLYKTVRPLISDNTKARLKAMARKEIKGEEYEIRLSCSRCRTFRRSFYL
ncbi:MAG: hypothetical protein ACLR6B_16015 [Blautia sp.]